MQETEKLQSPCNKQCIINPRTNYCMGCFRTIDEIIKWINFSDEERKEIMLKIQIREKIKLIL